MSLIMSIVNWVLSLFGSKKKQDAPSQLVLVEKQKVVEKEIKELDKKLEEVRKDEAPKTLDEELDYWKKR